MIRFASLVIAGDSRQQLTADEFDSSDLLLARIQVHG